MQEQPIVIRNMQGEAIARLDEEQGCTDDLSTAFLDELDLCTCKNKTTKNIKYCQDQPQRIQTRATRP